MQIQFSLPLEGRVTLSYFLFRYLFDGGKIPDDLFLFGLDRNKEPQNKLEMIKLIYENRGNIDENPSGKKYAKFTSFKSDIIELIDDLELSNAEMLKLIKLQRLIIKEFH